MQGLQWDALRIWKICEGRPARGRWSSPWGSVRAVLPGHIQPLQLEHHACVRSKELNAWQSADDDDAAFHKPEPLQSAAAKDPSLASTKPSAPSAKATQRQQA